MPKKGDDLVRIDYQFVGKKTDLFHELTKSFPPQFIPTTKTVWILMGLILFVTGYGIFQSLAPIMDISFDISKGEAFELAIEVGMPLTFFGTVDEGKKIEINVWYFLVDFILYTILAYIIDILINFLLSLDFSKSPDDLKKKPKVIKFRQRTQAEIEADKIKDQSSTPNPTPNPENNPQKSN